MWNMDETKETDKAGEGEVCEKHEFLSYDDSNEVWPERALELMVNIGMGKDRRDAADNKSAWRFTVGCEGEYMYA